MYTLYIANKNYSSWSLRPWALMTELGIAFKEVLVPFGAGSNWEEFRRFAPNGKVPCLVDDGLTVWDSLSIVEFLAERHPGVWPAQSAARAWARSAAAEMHSGFGTLRTQCSMSCGIRVHLHEIGPALKTDLNRLDELWRDGLEKFGGPFLAGQAFTAVDAFFAPVAFRVQTYGLPLSEPAQAYVQHLLQCASLQQWQQQALAEPWREPGHEADCLAYGTLTADLR